MYCTNCGKVLSNTAKMCPNCGDIIIDPNKSPQSWWAAFFLCFFLGQIGAHRFYAGRIWTGLLMLLFALGIAFSAAASIDMFFDALGGATPNRTGAATAGLIFWICVPIVSLWWIYDAIMLLAGRFKDGNGLKLKRG